VHGIALAPDLGKGFTSNGRADTVTVFDLKTSQRSARSQSADTTPTRFCMTPTTQACLHLQRQEPGHQHHRSGNESTLGHLPAGGKPEFAASDGAGRIFFNIEDTAQIGVIDSAGRKTSRDLVVAELRSQPTGLALDKDHERLFSVCQNGVMIVTDAQSGKHVAEVPIGAGPDAAAYDAARGLVFSSNGQDGTLTVIHEDDPDHYSRCRARCRHKRARAPWPLIPLRTASMWSQPNSDPRRLQRRNKWRILDRRSWTAVSRCS
jgi:DNA-binding beta-propeller fold protein YncE